MLASLVACTDGGDETDDAGGDVGDVGDVESTGAPVEPLVSETHWHAAFGVYVCDEFLPPIPEFETVTGIHSHGDDVIHIHPFTPEAAGENATLSVFLDEADIEVSDEELTVAGETYTEGEDSCDGEDGEVTLVRWADVADSDAEPERADVDSRFRRDGEGYVAAFVPEGTDIPEPESAAQLEALGGVDGDSRPSSTSTPPEAADGDDAPAAPPDDRTLADGFYEVEQSEPAPCRTPGTRADVSGELCYLLPDRPAVGTDIIEEAEPSVSMAGTGDWQVDVVLSEDGIDAFNAVAARCSPPSQTCPLGQLALVVDDEVVMAPTLQQASFERDAISVSGDFTRDEAESLADALTG